MRRPTSRSRMRRLGMVNTGGYSSTIQGFPVFWAKIHVLLSILKQKNTKGPAVVFAIVGGRGGAGAGGADCAARVVPGRVHGPSTRARGRGRVRACPPLSLEHCIVMYCIRYMTVLMPRHDLIDSMIVLVLATYGTRYHSRYHRQSTHSRVNCVPEMVCISA